MSNGMEDDPRRLCENNIIHHNPPPKKIVFLTGLIPDKQHIAQKLEDRGFKHITFRHFIIKYTALYCGFTLTEFHSMLRDHHTANKKFIYDSISQDFISPIEYVEKMAKVYRPTKKHEFDRKARLLESAADEILESYNNLIVISDVQYRREVKCLDAKDTDIILINLSHTFNVSDPKKYDDWEHFKGLCKIYDINLDFQSEVDIIKIT